MSRVIMPALLFRLTICAALVVALGAAAKTDWYRAQHGASLASSGPKLPIKSSFSGYIIAVG